MHCAKHSSMLIYWADPNLHTYIRPPIRFIEGFFHDTEWDYILIRNIWLIGAELFNVNVQKVACSYEDRACVNTNVLSYTVFHGVVVITADAGLCFINLCIFSFIFLS